MVVIAYGVRKKGTIAGSVSTVKAEKIEDTPAAAFDQALQGQVPGLTVLSDSGEPSEAAAMAIRGTNSINSGTAPLYILDGVAISSRDFNTINPSDIESLSVLKDASSTSIYGARAANGVIVITTKRGRMADRAKINYRMQLGFSQIAYGNWDLMNTSERIQYEKELGLTDGKNYNVLAKTDVNWLDEVFSNAALLQNYELSVSGASEKTNYYVSGGYYSQDGTAVGSSFERYSIRANVEQRAAKWLKLGTNTMMNYQTIEKADDGEYTLTTPISAARFMLPYWNPHRADGSLASVNDGSWKGEGQNPLEWLKNNPVDYKKYKIISTVFAEATPIEGLTLRSQFGVDYSHSTGRGISYPSYAPNLGSGTVQRNSSDGMSLSVTNTITYRFDIDNKHMFTFLAGQEGLDYRYEAFSLQTKDQNNDKLVNISSSPRATRWSDTTDDNYAYLSFFGRAEYSYSDRYYADFSLRTDGSSRFGASNRWAGFWSVGFMWNLRNEKFMENSRRWLTLAQIAVSTGTSGNSEIPNYEHLALVTGGQNYFGNAGIAPTQPGNEELSWEKLWTTNVALHLGFWNRLNLDVELYNKKTTDMLMEVPESYADKGYGYHWSNVGGMVNRGVELSLSGAVVASKDFLWSVNANVSYNKNKITELYNGVTEYEMSSDQHQAGCGTPRGRILHQPLRRRQSRQRRRPVVHQAGRADHRTPRRGQGADRQELLRPVAGRLRHDADMEGAFALGAVRMGGRPLDDQQRPLFRRVERPLRLLQPVETPAQPLEETGRHHRHSAPRRLHRVRRPPAGGRFVPASEEPHAQLHLPAGVAAQDPVHRRRPDLRAGPEPVYVHQIHGTRP